jgi:Kef-type K+ transport system membrane component KefB
MKLIMTLFLIVAISLIGSRLIFNRKKIPMGPRNILLTGTEFIFIGFLLGPSVLDIIDASTMRNLHPFLSFGLGWIGFLFGLQFDLGKTRNLPKGYFAFTMIQALMTLVIVHACFFAIFYLIMKLPLVIAFAFSMTLATVAACTGQSSMAIIHRDYHIPSKGLMYLFRYVAAVDALLSILFFGLVLSYFKVNAAQPATILHLDAWIWFIASIVAGAGIGYISHVIILERLTQEELLLYTFGVITLASGISLYFKLSPLLINLVMGVVVANLSPRNIRLLEIMIRAERSIYILIVILAGALWRFDSMLPFILALVYIVIRIIGKLAGCLLSRSLNVTNLRLPSNMGLGLLSQGGIAVAIMVNFQQVYENPEVNILLTIVIFAVLFNELISPRFVLNIVKRYQCVA